MNKFILIIFFAFSANASVLDKGEGYFYSNLSFSTSKGLWLRGDEKTDYKGSAILGNNDLAKRNYYQMGVNGYYGLGHHFQVGAGLDYGIVHLSDAPILGAAKGDTRSQITSLFIEGSYELMQRETWDLITTLRYRHPGKQGRRHPEFLSFNDFTSYAELELKHNLYLKRIELSSLIKYKKTLTSLGNDHIAIEEKAYYQMFERFSIGLSLDYFWTKGGFDIASTSFNQFFATEGFLPVWNKKESWLGMALLTKYNLTDDWMLDSFIHRKLSGENTDIATTIGLGIGRSF
ncbi:MAG: hypothetical protein ACJAT2_000891 [Bacteriovoracaceae bacterium]|jgi:hypothetical protein